MPLVFSLEALDTSHVSTQVLHGERRVLFLEASNKLVQISVESVYLGCAGKSLGANLDLILQLSPCGSGKNKNYYPIVRSLQKNLEPRPCRIDRAMGIQWQVWCTHRQQKQDNMYTWTCANKRKQAEEFRRGVRDALEILCQYPTLNRDRGFEPLALYGDVLAR